MTTFSAITSGQIDAESYIDTTLAGQWTNNVLGIIEGDASADAHKIQLAAIEPMTPWELIETQTASSSSSIDFEDIDTTTYKTFMLKIRNLRPGTNGQGFYIRVGTGATPTYQATNYSYSVLKITVAGSTEGTGNSDGAGGTTVAIKAVEAVTSSTDNNLSMTIFCNDLDAADNTCFHWTGTSPDSGTQGEAGFGAGIWDNTTAVTAIRLLMSGGVITSGDFSLYGMRQ